MDNNRIRLHYPEGYTPKDFYDIIGHLIRKTTPKVEKQGTGIGFNINVIDYSEVIEKFGKKFKVNIFILLGEINIRIEEVKE